jgi:hypothetical protein
MRTFIAASRIAGTLAALLALAAAPAHAKVTLPASVTVKAGAVVHVAATTTSKGWCRLSGAASKDVLVPRAAKVTFSWRTPKSARTGRYKATVACGASRAATTIKVSGTRSGSRRISGGVRVRVKPSGAPAKRPAPRPDPSNTPEPTAPDPTVPPAPPVDYNAIAEARFAARLAVEQGTGQCTAWAAQMRPDVWKAIEFPGILADAQGGPAGFAIGPAASMTQGATMVGLPVTTTPRVGSLVVFQPGSSFVADVFEGFLGLRNFRTSADGPGHVGYVEAVDEAAGTITVSDMNGFAGLGNVGRGLIHTSSLSDQPTDSVAFVG